MVLGQTWARGGVKSFLSPGQSELPPDTGTLSVSVSLCFFFFLSICLTLCMYLSLSICLYESQSLCQSKSLYLYLYVCK